MISGRQTLATFDSSLDELRGRIESTAQLVEERNNKLLALQQDELPLYRELGRMRVEHLAGAEPVIADDAERNVEQLLEQRQVELQKIHRDITTLGLQRHELEARRKEQAVAVDSAAEIVDAAEKKTQDRLDKEPGYQQQLQVTKELERTLKHAQNKASQREEELESKGESYREDPLFMYLWNRKYATVEYEANGLTRWLDGRVARLIRYSLARVNYSKLQEIPLRLREHAKQVEEKAKKAFEELKALDTQAREEDGIPVLEGTLKKKEDELAAIDEQIEQTVNDQQKLEQVQVDFSTGQDRYFQQAVDYLTTELRQEDLQALRHQAYSTPFPEDDMIVSQLFDLEAQLRELEAGIQELKNENRRHQERLREMETLRVQFKRQRYDSAGTGFSDPALIGTVLGNLINGAMTSEAFWRILEQQRRYQQRQADPGFGSGGFGRGTIWGSGMGFPRGGGGIFGGGGFSFPGSGGGHVGGSSGGFRTGGGF